MKRILKIDAPHERDRIDRVLARLIPDLSRRQIRRLLDEGAVFVDGKRCRVASRQVDAPVVVTIDDRSLHWTDSQREQFDHILLGVQILEIHDDFLIVFKPAGVLSQGTEAGDRFSLLRYLKTLPELKSQNSVYPVHRLDQPTSGLVIVARSRSYAAFLSEQLRCHKLGRHYLAIVEGSMTGQGVIDLPVGRNGMKRPARTIYESQKIPGLDRSCVYLKLETGRMHQVRVHLASLKHPVIGDVEYGGKPLHSGKPLIGLHACRLIMGDRTWSCAPPMDQSIWDHTPVVRDTVISFLNSERFSS